MEMLKALELDGSNIDSASITHLCYLEHFNTLTLTSFQHLNADDLLYRHKLTVKNSITYFLLPWII